MKRCTATLISPLIAAAALFAPAALLSFSATAQTDQVSPAVRKFPANAWRGELLILTPPEISMNGKPDRLSPGSRIRNAEDFQVLSGTLVNRKLVVNYTRDNMGLVHQVWLLTREEAREKRAAGPSEKRY